jgi:hypothetical protein
MMFQPSSAISLASGTMGKLQYNSRCGSYSVVEGGRTLRRTGSHVGAKSFRWEGQIGTWKDSSSGAPLLSFRKSLPWPHSRSGLRRDFRASARLTGRGSFSEVTYSPRRP